jgi:hypothetical protein
MTPEQLNVPVVTFGICMFEQGVYCKELIIKISIPLFVNQVVNELFIHGEWDFLSTSIPYITHKHYGKNV